MVDRSELKELGEKLASETKSHRLQRQLDDLTGRYKTLHDDYERLENLLELKQDFDDTERIRNWEPPATRSSKTQMAAIVALSDWHVEERVDLKKTNGLNEYSPKIAERRAKRIFRLIPEYIRRYVPDADVLYLGLLGDFITGYIHEDLKTSNYMPPTHAILFARDLLASGIEYIKSQKVVKKIIIPTAVGNHGRTTEKQLVQMSEENSFEWLMYHVLAERFSGDKSTEFLISDAYLNHLNIFGRTVRFHHGEAIRYNGGVGGPTISANKKIAGWNKSPLKAELDVFGHLHTFFNGGDFIMNGSLIGAGAYSRKGAFPFEAPAQAFMGFSKSRGQYMSAKMYCDE